MPVDTLTTVDVIARNYSDELLSSQPPYPVYIFYHWLDADGGGITAHDGERTVLPAIIFPNGCLAVVARVRPPPRPGRFTLQLRLVQEGVSWIGEDHRALDRDALIPAC